MKPGDHAPEFALPDTDGAIVRLSELLTHGPVALFFYPAAMTAGCTRQACAFRDLGAEFAEAGVQRIGISRDSVDKQRSFAEQNGFDYPLLSDESGEVTRAYGVSRGKLAARIGAPTQRWSFAIDTDGKIVDAVHSELNFAVHADRTLAALRDHAGRSEG